jgi:predicted GIY-YIG superfamily endonuclease
MSSWFYMLRLKSGTLYPGATTDLDRRWNEHVAGDACQTTRRDPPTALVHAEEHPTFSAARRREAQIKRWSAKKKEALVSKNLETLRNLAKSHDNGPCQT